MKSFECPFDGPPENGTDVTQAYSKVKESKKVAIGFAEGTRRHCPGFLFQPRSMFSNTVFTDMDCVAWQAQPCKIYDQEQTS